MAPSRRVMLRSALSVGTLSTATALASADSASAASSSEEGVNWLNVMDAPFNATENGTTDDTAAIQAAIDALGTSGGTVYLPATPVGYLLDSSALALTTPGTVLRGDGPENTKLLIGAGFVGTAAVELTAYNCQVRDLSINGASSTTTSNPVCNAVEISGVRRCKVVDVAFFYVNGWAIEAVSTTAGGSSNPLGTQISQVFMSACAGGVHFFGSTAQNYAMNSQVTDMQFYLGGVTTGTKANLDAIMIEDSWDVLVENAITWMSSGTGSALHIKGDCAASFITNLDALGPQSGPCVLIEDGANGSPQNVQIQGGVIQQGSPGLEITGGAVQIHVATSRFINNQTHGITVAGSSSPIHIYNCMFNDNGAGLSGTNYDINWSGTSQGNVTNCWFGSDIAPTAKNLVVVEASVNIASAGQAVLVQGAAFQGNGASSTNWFTNLPAGVLEASSGAVNFPTTVTLSGGTRPAALEPSAAGNTALAVNVGGAQDFDAWRLLGDGSLQWGPGTGARDTGLARGSGGGLQLTQPSALVETIGGVVQAQTSTKTVANTTTATALTSFSVPANDPSAGSVYRLRGYGVYSTTGTPTLALALSWGGTSIASVPGITLPSSVTSAAFSYEAELVFHSSTTAVGMLRVLIDTSKTTDAASTYVGASSSAVTVTTSSTEALTVPVTWGTASSANTISLVGGSVERIA